MAVTSPYLNVAVEGNCVLAEVVKDRLLDAMAINSLGDALLDLLNRYPRISLVVDISSVQAMSSAMLGKLISLNKAVLADKGRWALCGSRKEIKPLFEVTKLNKLISMPDTAQSALMQFQRKPL